MAEPALSSASGLCWDVPSAALGIAGTGALRKVCFGRNNVRVCWSPHGPSWESQNSKRLLRNPPEKQRMQISPPHSRLRGCVLARLRSMGTARPGGVDEGRGGRRCISQGRSRVRNTQQRALVDLRAAETLGRWRRASMRSQQIPDSSNSRPCTHQETGSGSV